MSKARAKHVGGMFDRPGPVLTGASIIVALLWITFTATFNPHELLVGILATAVTIAFLANVLRTETMSLTLHARDLFLAWQLPGAILKDCWIVTAALFADLFGRKPATPLYRACGFKSSRHEPLLVGRSALAVAYCSTTPNMIVVGIDPTQSLMLFHQIRRDKVSGFAEQLGAAPASTRDTAASRPGPAR